MIRAGITALHSQPGRSCPRWSRRLWLSRWRSIAFPGRPWCHAVTARAFSRAGHVTFHLLASLSVILADTLTSMTQLLMTHVWFLHKCWFNMNEIRAAALWEAPRVHRIKANRLPSTSGKMARGESKTQAKIIASSTNICFLWLCWAPQRGNYNLFFWHLRQAPAAVGIWAILIAHPRRNQQ